ncbi:MAG TPA: His/Gly/Thr/Pro-type tRNA ligase C-terminal domain-containing protein, partial [Anaerolineae bacterium]|nr:His/Gly/Thr/Pro-type tRNA ligase C-terminal domain-containing protein [Anaerolineae bacterium]
ASYAVGLDRLLMAVIEAHHDEQGIIWPRSVAPYQVHLLGLNLNKPEIAEEVERLYGDLRSRGFSVLYDDRNASAGVKFNDADLIGLPLRLTLSSRSLRDGGVEVKWRGQSEREVRTLEDLPLVLRGFAPVDS